VLPGKGHLLVKAHANDYIAVQTTDNELEKGNRTGYPLYPDALVACDLKAGDRPHDLRVTVRRGVTLAGRLVTAEGKPVEHAVMLCWNQVHPYMMHGGNPVEVQGGRFELHGCDPKTSYEVFFLAPALSLGGVARLSAEQAGTGPMRVVLSPCGRASVRLVNKEGKPVRGFEPTFQLTVRPGRTQDGGRLYADVAWVEVIDPLHYPRGTPRSDDGGRVELPDLIPGATYRIYGYGSRQVREFKVKPAEHLRLRDLAVYEE
jgi:hypothetical protein